MSRAHAAQINSWLLVGNCHSCPEFLGRNVIHIFRTDSVVAGQPPQDRHCVLDGRRNLRMDYRDGDELDPSNLKNLDAYLDKVRPSSADPLLIHCHAGMCRSPTVAIYVLSRLERMHPIDAQHLVTREIYNQRKGEVCNVCYPPLKQIIRLWEAGQ